MFRSADKWLPGYLLSVARRPRRVSRPRHLVFCIADHFEPFRGGVSREAARQAVAEWVAAYRRVAQSFRDADGRPPQHTFFYPEEDYDPDCLDRLSELCRARSGEVEIHLHHRHDTAEGLRAKLVSFRDRLRGQHGLLGSDAAGVARYGFIHGNWALCNSRPDGDWCGVNEELGILRATGCYADFTFPSAPSPTQPRTVNAIYYAIDKPGRPRGCDRGTPVTVGLQPPASGPGLMLITGPLGLNWRGRKWGLFPRLDNGAITGVNPPTPARIGLWARQSIHVRGRPEWVFVKVHTHGCVAENRAVLLGPAIQRMHTDLRERFNDGTMWRLHYATARELYNMAKAAEAGRTGNPADYRNFEIAAPAG
jgi:hypothetical protein